MIRSYCCRSSRISSSTLSNTCSIPMLHRYYQPVVSTTLLLQQQQMRLLLQQSRMISNNTTTYRSTSSYNTKYCRPKSTLFPLTSISSLQQQQHISRWYHATTTNSTNDDGYPPHIIYPMPALSPTMEMGSIASWSIAVGDTFHAGEAICTIETDKANVDYEAQDDGILGKILVQPGQDVTVGTPICIIVEDVTDIPAFTNYTSSPVTATTAPASTDTDTTTTAATTTPATTPATTTTTSTPAILFPSARHLAESHGKDATVLIGSGKGGRVTKADVQYALDHTNQIVLPNLIKHTTSTSTSTSTSIPTTPTAPTPTPVVQQTTTTTTTTKMDLPIPDVSGQTKYDDIPNSKMRKIIASRLTASKREVPHCYVSMEVALDNIMTLRKQLQKNYDIKISVNDCIIRACALALRDVPQVNNSYNTKTQSIQTNTSIDISVAVATPTGLITPIVFHTDQLGLYDITNTVKDLANRAKDGLLQPAEYQGGTFSISNLGMFGITEFSAVINPPQAAILAVGGGTPTYFPKNTSLSSSSSPILYNENNDTASTTTTTTEIQLQTIMTAQLSVDRRVIDEATASYFLQVLRKYMETPQLLVL